MYKKRPHKVTVIRYSCVTGKAVWLYQGQSHTGERLAYWKTCKREMTLQRKWPKLMEQRAVGIRRLMDECLAAIPIIGGMSEAQRKAARTLQAMADNPPKYDGGFYNHIRAERRRRDKKSRRWHRKADGLRE